MAEAYACVHTDHHTGRPAPMPALAASVHVADTKTVVASAWFVGETRRKCEGRFAAVEVM